MTSIKNIFLYLKEPHNSSSKSSLENAISVTFFLLGSTISVFIFSVVLITTLGFFLGIPLNGLYTIAAIIPTFAFLLYAIKKTRFASATLIETIVIAALIIVATTSLFFTKKMYDISYDGQAYHQEAILHLANGWVPPYQQLQNFETNNLNKWVNHYPKATWLYEAGFYALTGDIESAKFYNYILIFMAFSLTLHALLTFKKVHVPIALLTSTLVVANPVVITQSLSFYVDGPLYLYTVSLIAISVSLFYGRKNIELIPLITLASVMLNIKTTAILYAGLTLFTLIAFAWYSERVALARKLFFIYIAIGIVSIGIIGFNPYITNTILKGHPLYPAAGKGAMDYIEANFPPSMIKHTSLTRFLISMFSEASNKRREGEAFNFKLPYYIYEDELYAYGYPDTMSAGFGPLSGALFLMAAYSAVILFVYHNDEKGFKLAAVGVGLITFATLITPVNAMARFVPQFWIVFVAAAFLALVSYSKIIKTIGIIMTLLLIYNIALVTQSYYSYQLKQSAVMRDDLEILAQRSKRNALIIEFNEFHLSNINRLEKAGVAFIPLPPGETCIDPQVILPDSIIKECQLEPKPEATEHPEAL